MPQLDWIFVLKVGLVFYAVLDLAILFFLRLGMKEKREYKLQSEIHGVSLIVCFKNEEENIRKYADRWLRQFGIREWEIILVNDGSTDKSAAIIEEKAKTTGVNYTLINIDQTEKQGNGKKYALLKGVEQAQYDHLVFTDADCQPASSYWMKKMSDMLGRNDLIIGISPYKYKKGFLNAWICWEALYTLTQYIGMAGWGRAYMGVGRNMAVKKDLFLKHNDFDSHYHIPSGDDDIFVNKAARSGVKVRVNFDREAYTYAEPVSSFGKYWKQKSRHNRSGKAYNRLDVFILGSIFLTPIAFYSLFGLAIGFKVDLFSCLLLLCVKECIQFFIFRSMTDFNWEKKNWGLSNLYRVLSLLLQLLTLVRNIVSPSKKWN
jgi:poly-beta-1,6-N-acetyl-D-glucosamine synthase